MSPARGSKAGEFSDLANTQKRVWARHFTAIQRHAIQKTSQACLKHTQAHPNPLPPAPRLTECRSRFSLVQNRHSDPAYSDAHGPQREGASNPPDLNMLSTRDLDCELNLSVDVPYDIIDPYLPEVRNRLRWLRKDVDQSRILQVVSTALQRQPKSNATNSEVFIVISQFFFPKPAELAVSWIKELLYEQCRYHRRQCRH